MDPELRVDLRAEALIERQDVLVRASDDLPRPERARHVEGGPRDRLHQLAPPIPSADPRPAQLDQRSRGARHRIHDRTPLTERQLHR